MITTYNFYSSLDSVSYCSYVEVMFIFLQTKPAHHINDTWLRKRLFIFVQTKQILLQRLKKCLNYAKVKQRLALSTNGAK